MQRRPSDLKKEVPAEKVVVGVLREGQVILGRRTCLRRLGLLGPHEQGEVPADYFKNVWLMVWIDKEDPPLVYAASRDGVLSLMRLMEHRTNEQVTMEAGIRGVEELLDIYKNG